MEAVQGDDGDGSAAEDDEGDEDDDGDVEGDEDEEEGDENQMWSMVFWKGGPPRELWDV